MAATRETLSPLLRSAQVRKLSLELCQKLLTPNNSPLGSPANSPASSPTRTCLEPERRGSLTITEATQTQLLEGVSHGIKLRRVSLIPGPHNHSRSETPAIQVLSPSPEKNLSEKSTSERFTQTGRRSSYGSLLFNKGTSSPSSKIRNLNDDNSMYIECPLGAVAFGEDAVDSSEYECSCSGKFVGYSDDQILGRGSFGVAYRGNFHGAPAAVKLINFSSEAHKESVVNEKNAIGLNHRNLAAVFAVVELESNAAMIVMELLKKDNLHRLLIESGTDMDGISKIRICGQIASAMAYCHDLGILHLDLKPQNVLLDAYGNCKLADFGTSRIVSEKMITSSNKWLEGTVAYKAPELFRGQVPNNKCDVYSFGVCMWQVLCREEPYSGLGDHAIIYQVVANELRPDSASTDKKTDFEPHSIFSNLVAIYKNCWETDPATRPPMSSVVERLILLLCSS